MNKHLIQLNLRTSLDNLANESRISLLLQPGFRFNVSNGHFIECLHLITLLE